MTAHCATCNCADDEKLAQPAASSAGIRRLALQAAETAVREAKDRRTEQARHAARTTEETT